MQGMRSLSSPSRKKLSGTYQCANLAAAETDAKVYIIDSETATQGEAIIVREAIRLREQGLSASRIAAELETFKSGCGSLPSWTA